MSYAGRTIDSPGLHISNATSCGTYSGSELKPYTGRPGAMDAFKLPSRVGNRLIEPRAVRAGVLSAPAQEKRGVARDIINAIRETS